MRGDERNSVRHVLEESNKPQNREKGSEQKRLHKHASSLDRLHGGCDPAVDSDGGDIGEVVIHCNEVSEKEKEVGTVKCQREKEDRNV